ncbi:Cytochrome b2 [Durusdinium trenchii]|uniref:Mitochondrial (L-lactate dehydrogenase [Cytochrome]) (L-lactate ferricytochrome C oxidoreductase) (L-LCR) n=1 Tax=Durusdinium trenchii TaxID=1381693 RepID=A0ABP0SJW0_9DINO
MVSKAELEKHKAADDCWIAINGEVYNVTDFLGDHPGGKKAILMYAGKDATAEFEMLHKPDIIHKYGKDMKVGKLE